MPKPLCRMKYLAHLEHDRDRISELTRAAFDRNLADRFRLRGHDAHRHRAWRRRSRLGPFGDHHRAAEGPRNDSCGHTWDLVKLSFDQGVGLTPGDVYWAWVNRDSGIVDEWDMMLQSMKPEERPIEVLFHDYRRFGGLLISTRREMRGKTQLIRLDDIQVSPDVPKGIFE